MDGWQVLLDEVVLGLWDDRTLSTQECNNFTDSIKSGIKCSDFYAGHVPISGAQRAETIKYMKKFQNNS